MPVATARCDQFLTDVDPARAYRIRLDTFPIVTDPPFVHAEHANFMRPDDWIVGVRFDEGARCYPAYMLDNSHVVNDTVDGRYYAIMHCEICCSNAVFLATLDDRRLTFGTGGLFGGTLALADEQTESLWSHGMGVAFDGPLAGACLVRVESFQASYEEWLALYPETEVMVWRAPSVHPDARHGHGTDAWFAKPGIEELVLRTMAVDNDDRLPENEIVVSLFTPSGHAALPVPELTRAGGLLASEVGGHEFVTLSGGPDSALTGTFHPHLDNEPESRVSLAIEAGRFLDAHTGSEFRVDGLAVSGPLAGRWLQPLATMTNKWHSLTCFSPDIPIVRAGDAGAAIAEGELAPVFDALRSDGFTLTPVRRLYALELPSDGHCGYAVEMNGEACEILLFSDESVAADQLLWTAHAVQAGPVVLASTPPLYADATNTNRYPDAEIAWSSLIDDPAVARSLARAAARIATGRHLAETSLREFVDRLRARGIDVVVHRACYRETLPVGARSGALLDIEGDPFIVLRFDRAADAAQSVSQPEHSIVAEHLVLQSDPKDIYANKPRMTRRRPDAKVSWSPLLASDEFRVTVRDAARGGTHGD